MDFSLNLQVNGLGDLQPSKILDKQMPWLPDEEEQKRQTHLIYRGDCAQNFESELRNIRHQKKLDKESKRKLKEIQMEINNFDRSIIQGQGQIVESKTENAGEEKLMTESSENTSNSCSDSDKKKKKKENKMASMELFDKDIVQLNEGKFKYCSPEKTINNDCMADPTFKPFMGSSEEGSETESLYSRADSVGQKSNKSLDDSPERRQMMRSPNKKNNKSKTKRIKKLLEESDLVDMHIRSQLDQIQEIRKQTKEAISDSEHVIE